MDSGVIKITTNDKLAAELALCFVEKTKAFWGGRDTRSPQETADTIQAIAIYAAAILSENPFSTEDFLKEVRAMALRNQVSGSGRAQ